MMGRKSTCYLNERAPSAARAGARVYFVALMLVEAIKISPCSVKAEKGPNNHILSLKGDGNQAHFPGTEKEKSTMSEKCSCAFINASSIPFARDAFL